MANDVRSMGQYEDVFESASQIADEEASDTDALLKDLEEAAAALGSAYNRVARATEPVRCVVQGRVESAMETLDKAIDLVRGIEE